MSGGRGDDASIPEAPRVDVEGHRVRQVHDYVREITALTRMTDSPEDRYPLREALLRVVEDLNSNPMAAPDF